MISWVVVPLFVLLELTVTLVVGEPEDKREKMSLQLSKPNVNGFLLTNVRNVYIYGDPNCCKPGQSRTEA